MFISSSLNITYECIHVINDYKDTISLTCLARSTFVLNSNKITCLKSILFESIKNRNRKIEVVYQKTVLINVELAETSPFITKFGIASK